MCIRDRAYETGKGSIVLRSRTEIEETKTGRERIVVTEFPYMVNKTKVHEHIVRLVQEKRIDGITAVRDESNREGVRFVIEVRRDASANVILNNLFKMTQMQTNFGFNMLAIQNGVPVSYTHLDVYKRQQRPTPRLKKWDLLTSLGSQLIMSL